MDAEIINIGDELLIGQVVNTNAAWMSEILSLAGFRTTRVTVIRDEGKAILEALAEAERRSPVVLISGGIGPTRDDITKQTLCEYFGTKLVFDPGAYADIERIFSRRGMPVTELNRQQAELPESCLSLPNPQGTARGMWFDRTREDGTPGVVVSMPGVPFEMKGIMELEVIPRLKKIFRPPAIIHRTILTQGVGESFLAAEIGEWENSLPSFIRLAYLPQPGIVRLRLTGTGDSGEEVAGIIDRKTEELYRLIPDYIFGEEGDTLEVVTGRLLSQKGATVSTAESCTGGYIAHLITSVAGSSGWFRGSVVAYDNSVKTGVLGVPAGLIENHGAVSEPVVRAMAGGVKKALGTDYAIAVSGIAGPGGGTEAKPVGTTWIAVASPAGTISQHFLLGDHRERNIRRAALQALNMLRRVM